MSAVPSPLAGATPDPLYQPPVYRTPAAGRQLPWPMRWLPGTSLRFYAGVLSCIRDARRCAATTGFTQQQLCRVSENATRYCEGCGGRIEATGLDYLRATPGAAVIIGNHMSSLETFILPGIIIPAKPLCFVIKSSLLTHPIFGAVMRGLDSIPVGRTNPRQDLQTVMTKGPEMLRQGFSLCVFPQATRSVEFQPANFNSLGVKLARRAGVPVIPLALRSQFWGNGSGAFKDVGRIRPDAPVSFAFGEPLSPDLPQAELHQRVVSHITGHLTRWGIPCATGDAPPAEEGR